MVPLLACAGLVLTSVRPMAAQIAIMAATILRDFLIFLHQSPCVHDQGAARAA
jgi:hypothetical protein